MFQSVFQSQERIKENEIVFSNFDFFLMFLMLSETAGIQQENHISF